MTPSPHNPTLPKEDLLQAIEHALENDCEIVESNDTYAVIAGHILKRIAPLWPVSQPVVAGEERPVPDSMTRSELDEALGSAAHEAALTPTDSTASAARTVPAMGETPVFPKSSLARAVLSPEEVEEFKRKKGTRRMVYYVHPDGPMLLAEDGPALRPATPNNDWAERAVVEISKYLDQPADLDGSARKEADAVKAIMLRHAPNHSEEVAQLEAAQVEGTGDGERALSWLGDVVNEGRGAVEIGLTHDGNFGVWLRPGDDKASGTGNTVEEALKAAMLASAPQSAKGGEP